MTPEPKSKTPAPAARPAESRQGTPFPVPQSPVLRASGKSSDTPQPFRAKTPLPESSAKSDSATPVPMQPAESSGPTKPAPATNLDDAIVQAVVDNHETVPISVKELRKRGLLE